MSRVRIAVGLLALVALAFGVSRGCGVDEVRPVASPPVATDDEPAERERVAVRPRSSAPPVVDERRAVAPETDRGVPLAIRETLELRVTVLRRSDDSPLAGATVRAAGETLRTASDGTARLQLEIAADDVVQVAAAARGFASATRSLYPSEIPRGLTEGLAVVLRLVAGGSVSGTVVGPDGVPLPRAVVELQGGDGLTAQKARADDAGRFRFDGVPIERAWHLAASARGRHWPLLGPETRPTVSLGQAGETSDVEIRLRKAALLRVFVRGTDGEGATGCLNVVGTDSSAGVQITGGRARCWHRPGGFEVHVSPDDGASEPTAVTLVAGETTYATIQLTNGAAIEGTVVDARGAPLVGVDVYVACSEAAQAPYRFFDKMSRTGPDGSFRIGGLNRDAYRLSVVADRLPVVHVDPIEPPVSGRRVVIPDWALLRVPIRAEDGSAPPETVSVSLGIETHVVYELTSWSGDRELPVRDGVCEVRCGPTVGLLAVKTEGFLSATVRVTPHSGSTRTTDEVVLSRGSSVSGRVLGVDGRPAADVRVHAWDAAGSGMLGTTTTAAGGRFEIAGMADGLRWLRASREGAAPAFLRLESDGDRSGIELRLTRGGVVRGVVPDPGPRGANVSVVPMAVEGMSDGGGALYGARSDAAGAFSIRAPVGRVRIVVHDRRDALSVEVEVVEGETVDVDLSR